MGNYIVPYREPPTTAPVGSETAALLPDRVIEIDQPLAVADGSREVTNSRDRSVALAIRLGVYALGSGVFVFPLALVGGAGVTLAIALTGGVWFAVCCFADFLERRDSRNGLERHKVNALAQLKRIEMDHQQQVRLKAIEMIERRFDREAAYYRAAITKRD